ncbi:hypothetical protein ABS767_09410 [Sphingomonas sp. ST-64]|uniref:MORN repeat-containing protein n=1 Tax=Sphingomonas plantiphila TaxID=3163295 RepID=A0ABW8YM66_9SPHN
MTTWIAALVALLFAGSSIRAQVDPPSQLPAPAKFYVSMDKDFTKCAKIAIGDASPVPFRTRVYYVADLWPGTAVVRLTGCNNRSGRMTYLFNVESGENFAYLGTEMGGGFQWSSSHPVQGNANQGNTAQAIAFLTKRRRGGEWSLSQTSAPIQLAGGTYTGPLPYEVKLAYSLDSDIERGPPRAVVGQIAFPGDVRFLGQVKGDTLVSGRASYPDGSTYIGEFGRMKNGQQGRIGFGRLVQPDGSVFMGQFDGNQATGIGVCGGGGAAPAICSREKGKGAETPSIASSAAKAVAAREAEQKEALAERQRIVATAADRKATTLAGAKKSAASSLKREDREMERECSCVLKACLAVIDTKSGKSEKEQLLSMERARLRQLPRCKAWQGTATAPFLERVAAREREVQAEIDALAAERVRREQQDRAALAALAARQKAERDRLTREAAAAEAQARQAKLDRIAKICRPVRSCGCGALLGEKPKPGDTASCQ